MFSEAELRKLRTKAMVLDILRTVTTVYMGITFTGGKGITIGLSIVAWFFAYILSDKTAKDYYMASAIKND